MKKITLSLLFSMAAINTVMAFDEVDELIIEEDPYIGVTIDFAEFSPMVSLSNTTGKLTPSKYTQKLDRLITSLAQSKTATKDLFKKSHKKLEYLPQNSKFKVKSILKTAVYTNNTPDEYTTYLLENSEGVVYAMPDFELKDVSRVKLTSYEKGLLDKMEEQQNYARVIVYLKKPPLYKDKQPPYSQKDLSSVFDYFLDQIKPYSKDTVLLSERNFRLSMNIPMNTLAYLISEFDALYIEDIEIVSPLKRKADEQDYNTATIRTTGDNNPWYQR